MAASLHLPNNEAGWVDKGDVLLFEDGKYDEAIKAYNMALRLPDSRKLAGSIWLNKGYALDHLGRYDEALQACDKAIDNDPNPIARVLVLVLGAKKVKY